MTVFRVTEQLLFVQHSYILSLVAYVYIGVCYYLLYCVCPTCFHFGLMAIKCESEYSFPPTEPLKRECKILILYYCPFWPGHYLCSELSTVFLDLLVIVRPQLCFRRSL